MKLRIRADSLRLRLKRGEVDKLASGTGIVEQTHFPNSMLTIRLDVAENNDISASFDNEGINVKVPRTKVLDWAGTDQVSLYAEQQLPDSGSLSLLIEKDFTCLEPGHHRDCEDDEDTFPHPSAQSTATLQS
jgi:hypothetical protein